jgi:hypothetical protein
MVHRQISQFARGSLLSPQERKLLAEYQYQLEVYVCTAEAVSAGGDRVATGLLASDVP